jgi:hypothetical protein
MNPLDKLEQNIQKELDSFKQEITLKCADLIENAILSEEFENIHTREYKVGYRTAQKEFAEMLRKVANNDFSEKELERMSKYQYLR